MKNDEPLHVLFVEDSEDDKELLLEALAPAFGTIVHERVESAAALRTALARRPWDVILCDHNMPALDAPAALGIAQAMGLDTPFIVVSGRVPEETAIATMMSGAADTVGKDNLPRLVPVLMRELRKSLEVSNLRRIARHDPLTGLPNQAFLADWLESFAAGTGGTRRVDLAVIHISRFSLILHGLGTHAAGQVLRLIGECLSRTVGDAGAVARLGDDRFGVLLTEPGSDAATAALVERINDEMARPMEVAGRELFIAHRTGIAVYPRDGRDFSTLVTHADMAMHQVGVGGRRNYAFFDPAISAAGQERLAMEQALHRAMQQHEFVLRYQPQYDVGTGCMIGMEALLRWERADGTWVAPGDFIPLLEETGLIVPVGEWVLRTACRQNVEWQAAGLPPVPVAVNLSPIQFLQPDLLPMVQRVLAETGLDARYLELEITENAVMHNEESTIVTLTQLRAMNVTLAIDDFGIGYSSLSYLRHFPVHKLKIDRSFVNDITEENPGSPIVKALVSLAHNLGLDVIAEGVETQCQVDFLMACGCQVMQGYLFSEPVPAEDILRVRCLSHACG